MQLKLYSEQIDIEVRVRRHYEGETMKNKIVQYILLTIANRTVRVAIGI